MSDVTAMVALLDLADVDAGLDRLEARARALTAQRAESEAMAAVDAAGLRHRAVAEESDQTRRAQIRLEGNLSEVEDRIRRADERLRQLSDPHQIEAAQREVDTLRGQRSGLEDELLEAMERAETTTAGLEEAEHAERVLRERADAENEELVGELGEVEGALHDARQRRTTLARGVPTELLDQYEAIRAKGVRPAAARFEGGRCQGCHLALSATEVDQLRSRPAGAVMFCSECGCLLVRSPRAEPSEVEPDGAEPSEVEPEGAEPSEAEPEG